MAKKRLLFVTQEMKPYTVLSEIGEVAYKLPQYAQDSGLELRVLMPKFGTINERRHRLHEVVRLSGMNIIVDNDDFPLVIKVASLPGSRMQVYFLDNDDFFKRKSVFEDEIGKPFQDNIDRMVFFCKGVIETVKKFGWAPDLIHCNGWMTSLIPFYLRTAYKNDPLFRDAKVIYSAYENSVESTLKDDNFFIKASINNLSAEDLQVFKSPGEGIHLQLVASKYADALMIGSENLNESVQEAITGQQKPFLPYLDIEANPQAFLDFYTQLAKL